MKEQSNSATLIVPNDLAFSEVVGAYVKAMARKVGFDDEEQSMIELGVDEAFTNIVEHAFDPEEDATFDVVCQRIPLGLKISLREKGLPFDPSRIPEYIPGMSLQKQSGRGLGFFLMKQTMDEVSFNNLGKQGKETQLVKFLKKKNVKDYFDESQLEQFEEPFERKKKLREKIDITIRRMLDPEALEVSRCVYRTYGYSYGKEHAYYPERIVELNDTGLMVSAVATTKTDEVAGHCALMKYEVSDPTAEIGMAVVKPKFRGQGCMNGMMSYLIDSAREEGLVGVYAHAVAIHPYSQKAMQSFGLHDCNILLANVPTTMSFKGISEELSQRDSHVVSFRYLNKPENLITYVPEHHREIVGKLYRNTELDPEIRTECSDSDPMKFQESETVITSRVNTARGIAYVDVERSGPDIANAVQTTLKDLLLKRMDAIYLYLSMQDPAICSVTKDIEDMGFFFAGIFPGKAMGDALVLQYLNNIQLDYSKISLASEMAKELCGYIKPLDPNQ